MYIPRTSTGHIDGVRQWPTCRGLPIGLSSNKASTAAHFSLTFLQLCCELPATSHNLKTDWPLCCAKFEFNMHQPSKDAVTC